DTAGFEVVLGDRARVGDVFVGDDDHLGRFEGERRGREEEKGQEAHGGIIVRPSGSGRVGQAAAEARRSGRADPPPRASRRNGGSAPACAKPPAGLTHPTGPGYLTNPASRTTESSTTCTSSFG